MRFSALILAIYFLSMVFFPCADNPHVHDSTDHSSLILTDIEHSPCGDHHHNPEDSCSPLCFCHCCHTHVSTDEAFVFTELIFTHNSPYTQYKESVAEIFPYPPFRPPQV